MKFIAAVSAVSLIALAGCEDGVKLPGRDTTPIAGNYLITRVNGDPVPAPGITLTLQQNGSFSGRSLCNTYKGSNARKWPGFRVGAFTSSKRGCDPNLQRVEQDYFRTLTTASGMTQGSGGLSFSGTNDSNNQVTVDARRR